MSDEVVKIPESTNGQDELKANQPDVVASNTLSGAAVKGDSDKFHGDETRNTACGQTTNKTGLAFIKPEFIVQNHQRKVTEKYLPAAAVLEIKQLTADNTAKRSFEDTPPHGDVPQKKVKLRGRNKKRPHDKLPQNKDKLCPAVIAARECSYGDKCKFSHDVAEYVKNKPAAHSSSCYLFDTFGKCPYGVTCLCAAVHTGEGYEQVVNEELWSKCSTQVTTTNKLPQATMWALSRKKYNLDVANNVMASVNNDKPVEPIKLQRPQHYRERWDVNHGDGVLAENPPKTSIMDPTNGAMSSSRSLSSGNQPKSEHCEVNASNKCISLETQGEIQASIASNESVLLDKQGNRGLSGAMDEDCINMDVGNSQNGSVDDSNMIDKSGGSNLEMTREAVSSTKNACCDALKSNINGSMEMEYSGGDNVAQEALSMGCDNPGSGTTSVQLDKSTPAALERLQNVDTAEGVIKMRPQEIKKVEFRDKLYLAPLTTVGNLPFRRICKSLGADITCSEMATATGLLQGNKSEWALLKRHATEDVFGAQVCGSSAEVMTRCAQVLMENTDVNFMDINCGCPIELFFRKGEGCALMGKTTRLQNAVRGMQALMDVPLTVKIRTGIYEGKNIAAKVVTALRDLDVSMVTLHGRSREQRYTRSADWDYIQKCAEIAAPMPLFGNGDVLSYEEYNLHKKTAGVAGCLIARGALMKPWLFTEIKEQRHWDISSTERLDLLRNFANYGLEHWGSDQKGVQTTRRFLLEWLSFLYRYIPVGVLEQVPQKINEKPPYYVGRNDLETLMASPNCADWIKLSEMLLGPVPDGFQFLPKHKANSYQ